MKKILLILSPVIMFLQVVKAQKSGDGVQEKLYMPYFELINLDADYEYSTSQLFKSYVDERDRYLLVLPKKPADGGLYPEESLETSIENASKLHAKYVLRGSLNHIGERVIITVTMYNLNGRKIWTDKLTAK